MDDPTERWLPVVGYQGFYEVSDQGRVRSLPRETVTGIRGGKMLKACPGGYGYVVVGLSVSGHAKVRAIHRLVAAAFIGPCPEGQQVRHGPGGKVDNRLVNLCYGTPTEDSADKIRDGTMNFGERHGLAKLTTAIVDECRRRAAAGGNQSALAREFGVDPTTMWNAITGRTWIATPAVVPVRTGKPRGEGHGMAKLTEAQVTEIRGRHAEGEFQRMIARDYGVSRQTVGKIVTRKRWANT